jgi:hypothetical protein
MRSSLGGVVVALDTRTADEELAVELGASGAGGATVVDGTRDGGRAASAMIELEEVGLRLCRGLVLEGRTSTADTGILERVRPAGFSPAGCEGSRRLRRMHREPTHFFFSARRLPRYVEDRPRLSSFFL